MSQDGATPRYLNPQMFVDSTHKLAQGLLDTYKVQPDAVRALDINANRLKSTIMRLRDDEGLSPGELALGCMLTLVALADEFSTYAEHSL